MRGPKSTATANDRRLSPSSSESANPPSGPTRIAAGASPRVPSAAMIGTPWPLSSSTIKGRAAGQSASSGSSPRGSLHCRHRGPGRTQAHRRRGQAQRPHPAHRHPDGRWPVIGAAGRGTRILLQAALSGCCGLTARGSAPAAGSRPEHSVATRPAAQAARPPGTASLGLAGSPWCASQLFTRSFHGRALPGGKDGRPGARRPKAVHRRACWGDWHDGERTHPLGRHWLRQTRLNRARCAARHRC